MRLLTGTIGCRRTPVEHVVLVRRKSITPPRPTAHWRRSTPASQRRAAWAAGRKLVRSSGSPNSFYRSPGNWDRQMYLMIARFQFDCEIDLSPFFGMFFKLHHHEMIPVWL